MDRIFTPIDKNNILALCLKWEAIRRTEEYRKFYIELITRKTKRINRLMEDMRNRVNSKEATARLLKLGKLDRKLYSWGMTELIDPNYSFLRQLFANGKFSNKQNITKRLILLFNDYSVRCDESPKDFGIGFYDEQGSYVVMNNPSSHKELKKRSHITLRLDITRSKKELLTKIEAMVDHYKRKRIALGLEPRPEKKFRFRAESNMGIFETFDLVRQNLKMTGKYGWADIARKRYPDSSSNRSNLINIVKDEYKRALRLIKGGFKDLGA